MLSWKRKFHLHELGTNDIITKMWRAKYDTLQIRYSTILYNILETLEDKVAPENSWPCLIEGKTSGSFLTYV